VSTISNIGTLVPHFLSTEELKMYYIIQDKNANINGDKNINKPIRLGLFPDLSDPQDQSRQT